MTSSVHTVLIYSFLSQGFSLNPELASLMRLVAQQAVDPPVFPTFPCAGVTHVHLRAWLLHSVRIHAQVLMAVQQAPFHRVIS